MQIHLESSLLTNTVSVYLRDGNQFAYSVSFQEIPAAVVRPEPIGTMTPTEAQQLMDNLWQCGFRPTEGKGSAGQLAATDRHLQDMRAIAFHSLGVTAP
jgi:hypothetical protein